MMLAEFVYNPDSWAPLIEAALRSTLLLALTAAATLLMRRASAATRHFVWTLGLSGALLLPVLSAALPEWEVPLVTVATPQSTRPDRESTGNPAPLQGRLEAPRLERRTLGSDLDFPTAAPPPGKSRADPGIPGMLLLGIWLAGAIAILGRLMVGLAAVHWLSRRTAQVADASWLPLARQLARDIGIRNHLTFRQSTRATMPMAWGIVRPSVLMPADADSWPLERLRIVLLHELAHVKRRDSLTNIVSQIACAVHWFNPLVWIAARHARGERERACDDLVLAAGTRGTDYADQLLEIARAHRESRFPLVLTGATLAMAHRTQLEGRLIAILDPRVPRSRLSRAGTAAAATLAACALVPVALIQPWVYAAAPAVTFEPIAPGRKGATVTSRPDAIVPQPDGRKHTPQRPGSADDPAGERAAATLEAIVEAAAERAIEGAMQGSWRGALEAALGAWAVQPPQPAQRAQPAQPAPSKEPAADPRTIAALTAALKDPDVEVREAAMHALVQLRDPAIYDALVAALHDASADIREQAAFALSQLRDPRAIEPLRQALKDQSAGVREQAVFALGQLRDKATAAAIAQALQDENACVREQAAFALGQLRDRAYLDALAAALKDSSASVREQAAFALSQLGDARATAALAAAISDVADSVREQVVFALGQLGDPASVDLLVKALRDEQPDIREQAAFALGQIGESRAVTALISALKDADADVRAQAAFALGQIGDRSAVEPLVIALKDANADVRSQAAFALAQLRDPRATDALTAALKDADADVRRQAAFALGQIH